MPAVGAATRHQFNVIIEQKRSTRILHHLRQCLNARDHGALVGLLQPHQHRRHVGGREQSGQLCDKP